MSRGPEHRGDDLQAERKGQDVVRVVGPAAEMQKEDEVDADLREGEHDQPDRYARGPQQIGLRYDERADRRQDREPEPGRVGQKVSRGLFVFDTRRAVVEYAILTVHHWKSPIR